MDEWMRQLLEQQRQLAQMLAPYRELERRLAVQVQMEPFLKAFDQSYAPILSSLRHFELAQNRLTEDWTTRNRALIEAIAQSRRWIDEVIESLSLTSLTHLVPSVFSIEPSLVNDLARAQQMLARPEWMHAVDFALRTYFQDSAIVPDDESIYHQLREALSRTEDGQDDIAATNAAVLDALRKYAKRGKGWLTVEQFISIFAILMTFYQLYDSDQAEKRMTLLIKQGQQQITELLKADIAELGKAQRQRWFVTDKATVVRKMPEGVAAHRRPHSAANSHRGRAPR